MKKCLPIVTGNIKYLGLSTPEWSINSLFFALYFMIGGPPILKFALPIHMVAIIAYTMVLGKLEENILQVLIENMKIKGRIIGIYKKKMPIQMNE